MVQVTKLCGTVVVKVVKVQSLETRVVNKHRGYIVMKITLFFFKHGIVWLSEEVG